MNRLEPWRKIEYPIIVTKNDYQRLPLLVNHFEEVVPVGFIQIFNICRHPAHSGMIEVMIAESKRKLGYAKRGIGLLEDSWDTTDIKTISHY